MKIYRDRTRGRADETPMAYAFLVMAALLLVAAAFSWGPEWDGWTVARTVVAVAYAPFAVWYFLRARRRDRAARAACPPRE